MDEAKRIEIMNLKFKPLRFGTSGLRDTVINMTDMECYINTKGFIGFLEERKELTSGSSIAVAGDRRESTPRIMAAVMQAITDSGYKVVFAGFVPTPTLAYFAITKGFPSIMVTGSHIPDDRNGIKFTKKTGEVLKSDEADILKNVKTAREKVYGIVSGDSLFNDKGMFKEKKTIPAADSEAEAIDLYVKRYLDVFPKDAFKGKKIVLYQHSAVGRDILKTIFEGLSAELITVSRSEVFVPVDTEKVSKSTMDLLKESAGKYQPFAIISTDGDSDRPLLADEKGDFLPGDKLGALVSVFLKPTFVAIPISANDAVVSALEAKKIKVVQTKIGSPYVVKAMSDQLALSADSKVVSWESNGGFLLGSDWQIEGKTLKALPTRDAVLPLVSTILLAIQEGKSVSGLIDSTLPERFTHADVIDDKTAGCGSYTASMGKEIIKRFSPKNPGIVQTDFEETQIFCKDIKGETLSITEDDKKDLVNIKDALSRYFDKEEGFGKISKINFVDGIRITFTNNDVAHLRPSGNAPEFRMYATADTQVRADQIVKTRLAIVPRIIKDMG